MEIDPMETIENLEEERAEDKKSMKLNMMVAVTVAILATFMGICKVKDDNIVQAMQAAQANKIDHWNFYQARNLREEVAKSTVVQLKLAALGRTGGDKEAYLAAIADYEKLAKEQARKKEELKTQAEQDQLDYDASNYKDDQFDLSDALLAVAISLLAVTALTKQKWLYFAALIPTAFGLYMGMAGLLGWQVHPETLIKLLS
ncbi:DUF4337 domain-containing protein [Undibacterium flavidum]|uniref:DUF4337 domain-containing protein n=1 Tax=Undibacterium flavidum TaxID=2762297 RepID=A0ABR6Y749_9BURK|nr:DUF4337 domain-containing protein [Undibacterium flavidum]MBC3871959.1 DUF4337 domain-containing protein [Undibacterium flavidum]